MNNEKEKNHLLSNTDNQTNKVKTREFKFLKSDYYVYKNTCLLKAIRVKRVREVSDYFLVINGVKLKPTTITKTWVKWDFATLRKMFQEALGVTKIENEWIALEETLYHNEVNIAQKHYTQLTYEEYHTSIMTSELQVALFIKASTVPKQLEAEEDVYISDVHQTTYGPNA
jgi:hypothetical protein